MKPYNLLPTLLLFSICLPALVQAKEFKLKDEDIGFRYTNYSIEYSLDDKAASNTKYKIEQKALKEEFVDYVKSFVISHSTSVEELEIHQAYTKKANGEKIDIPENNYQLEVNKGKGNNSSPAFSDETLMTILFPNVAVGDSIFIEYSIKNEQQYFPGHFSDSGIFSKHTAFDNVSVKLSVPVSLNLNYRIFNLKQKKKSENNGIASFEWVYSNKEPTKALNTSSLVYTFGSEPGYAFSTYKNYKEIAEQYGSRAIPKAAVTPRIAKLAKEITSGVKDERQVAKKIYDWVREEISYAGNCIGVGAVVPRDLDFVLDNKMGDCKDHATLLEALLKAKGIESSQALIGLSNIFELPDLPLVSAVNHVINYIPSLDLYVDSTDPVMPFGNIAHFAEGRRVLHVVNYSEDTKIPTFPNRMRKQVTVTNLSIKEDGTISGTVESKTYGQAAFGLNKQFKKITAKEKEDYEKQLVPNGFEGEVKWTHDYENSDEKSISVKFEFNIKNVMDVTNPGGMGLSPYFVQPEIYMMTASALKPVELPGKFWCSGGQVDEIFNITFPKNLELLAIPSNRKLENEYVSLTSTYSKEENVLKASRIYRDNTKGPICEPQVMDSYQEIGKKVIKDLQAQVVYRPKE